MKLTLRALALAGLACIGILLVWQFGTRPATRVDISQLNAIAKQVEQQWPTPTLTTPGAVFEGETPITSREVSWPSPLAAASDDAQLLPIVVDGDTVGVLAISADAGREPVLNAHLHSALRVATATIGILTLLAIAWVAVEYARVIRPFRRLEQFASDVAAGNLDAPLLAGTNTRFGAWQSSLDILRSELLEARANEDTAKLAHKQLIEQISHDIRTPIASIAANAELLELENLSSSQRERVHTIAAKAQQLATFTHDLDPNLVKLRVDPVAIGSPQLPPMFRSTDVEVRVDPIPPCIVLGDPMRLQQVIDNIIENSVKYAGTPITVTSELEDDQLCIHIADTGLGVPAAERGTLLGRGVRGSNSTGVVGQGLGLYTSAHLMERMGGAMWLTAPDSQDAPSGFTVTLALTLADS